jgi:putative ABC transport system ATP-binding protein
MDRGSKSPNGERSLMRSTLLELKQACRDYDSGRIQAVRDVSLKIQRGEWLTIVGPSGSGKSTLLNLMCGLDHPNRGEVLFEERPPGSAKEWAFLRSARIGIIFQAFNLLPTLSSLENVQIPMFGVTTSSRERRLRALELLARVGLDHRTEHLPSTLSAGERQRVAIARSLANHPSLLLADEPTGNLDTKNAAQILNLLRQIYLQDQTTIVLVTHDSTVAQMGTRKITVIDGGIANEQASEAIVECIS